MIIPLYKKNIVKLVKKNMFLGKRDHFINQGIFLRQKKRKEKREYTLGQV